MFSQCVLQSSSHYILTKYFPSSILQYTSHPKLATTAYTMSLALHLYNVSFTLHFYPVLQTHRHPHVQFRSSKVHKFKQNFIKTIIFSYEIKISEYELQNISNICITNDGSAYMALLMTSTNCCYSKVSITTDKQRHITSILYVINWRIKIWRGRRKYLQPACKMDFTGNQGLFRIFLGPTQQHILDAPSMHTAELTMKTRTL
jgi:hypothetical protein